ncbi:hypothetical protein D3OALGA1CA_5621 [Olavius algarvensis associated proteobacterium Delta 3]|nr:hypothetical protein D3OALGB2SA_31 [Olavius algarvensis associated proteobacterium Delta 3]CAB5169242.1 hypothetical protein D3OALGA1CA_5621 [Olavius algarvensis associated proteobacterium Delta 3]
MRYGAMNFPILPVLSELEDFAHLGFDYIEIAMDAPEGHYRKLQEHRQAIVAALDRYAMGLVCHLPTFVYTADLAEGIRQASLREMMQSMETAADLGAEKAVLHPSIVSGLGSLVLQEVRSNADESLAALVEASRRLNLPLCLENMFPKYHIGYDPSEFETWFARHPDLKLTLDTGHGNIDAPGIRRILQFVRLFGDRLGHLHVSDNHGRRDDHLPIGSGRIDFAKVVSALLEAGYDGTVTLEVFTEDRRALKRSRDRLASLIGEVRSVYR